MKKLILKYWMIDMMTGIILFVAFRIMMMDATAADNGFFATVLYGLDIILNLGFSLIYLVAVLLCSLTVLLNLLSKVRSNSFLSWLSFSGLPIALLVALTIDLRVNNYHFNGGVMTKLFIFSLLYVFVTILLFLSFRKKYVAQISTNSQLSHSK